MYSMSQKLPTIMVRNEISHKDILLNEKNTKKIRSLINKSHQKVIIKLT
jgi:hypothetical protein